MLQRTGEAETITTHYLAALGAYRALYIPNWIYRHVWWSSSMGCVNSGEFLTIYIRWYSDDSVDIIAVVAGLVQSGLYADFFYVYFTK